MNDKNYLKAPLYGIGSITLIAILSIKSKKYWGISGQEGGVGKCYASLLSRSHQNYNKLQNKHHWVSPEVQLNRSLTTGDTRKRPFQDW